MLRAYLTEYDNGAWFLPELPLNVVGRPAFALALAASPTGNAIAAWTQSDGENRHLYVRVFHVSRELAAAKSSDSAN